ncbi:MAG: methyltransferase domain-containing protein [Oligoflexia bacterium]|nr:methyltransferase domain-containing protein [Oligoflexia bacterium]
MPTGQLVKKASDQSLGLSSQTIYDCILTLVNAHKLGGSVLDYGAGVGALTKQLNESGLFNKTSAVDFMPRPENLNESVLWKQQNLNESILDWNNSFDLIIASEVIEHLENPRAMLRNCAQMLKPGGHIILSMPNNESLRSILSLIFRGHFVDFLDNSYPAHISALLLKDVYRIFNEVQLGEVKTQYTNSGKIPKFTNVMWPKLLFKGKRFSDNVIIVGVKR